MDPDDCPNLHHNSSGGGYTYPVVLASRTPWDQPTGNAPIFRLSTPTSNLSFGVMAPNDCPNFVDASTLPTGPQVVDLWCELLYAGYTEDEAFEMIEMVIGEDIAEPLPERLPVKSYEDMVNYSHGRLE